MLKNLFCLMFIASGVGLVCLRAQPRSDWPVREQETIAKTLSLSAAPMRLLVENIDGYVHVTSGDSSQVRVTAHKTIRAESDSDLNRAKAEVRLLISEQPGTVAVEYAAPWVCKNQQGISGCADQQRRFYDVAYDIDIEVPRTARPFVSTVNHGDIRIDGTLGDFEVKNVNGAISLTGIAGSGQVRTVNGPISVRFVQNPKRASSFATVNGQVDVYFVADLSADVRFHTLNGKIYSDFDVVPVAVSEPNGERRDGGFVYRSNGLVGGRVGNGGPEIKFNTLNGSIRLHRAGGAMTSNGASENE